MHNANTKTDFQDDFSSNTTNERKIRLVVAKAWLTHMRGIVGDRTLIADWFSAIVVVGSSLENA